MQSNDVICAHITPQAWTAQELRDTDEWTLEFTRDEIDCLRAAASQCMDNNMGVIDIDPKSFNLGSASGKVDECRKILTTGKGVVLLRGLPVDDMTKQEAGIIFWGLGCNLGRAAAQNAYGDVLGHVWNLGKDFTKDTKARGYQSNLKLNFHTDTTDVVGLLCLRAAKSGGLSSIVSSIAIHNHLLQSDPEVVKALYEEYSWDQRGEESEGDLPYTSMPVCIRKNEDLFIRYVKSYIESAQRFDDAIKLTALQKRALELVTECAHSDEFRFDMDLRPGDIQLLNNYCVLHSRTAYEDFEDIDQRRHMLRLWLFLPEYDDRRPAQYATRNRTLEKWREQPREPIYDVGALMQAEVQ